MKTLSELPLPLTLHPPSSIHHPQYSSIFGVEADSAVIAGVPMFLFVTLVTLAIEVALTSSV